MDMLLELNHHIKNIHNVGANYHQCPHCDFSTKYKSSLKDHLAHKHDIGAKLYTSPYCNFTTKHKRSISCHIKSFHPNND